MAQAIIASITDLARTRFAEMLQMGRAFTVTDFVVGSGGHDPSDAQIALSPDPSDTVLPLQSFGPQTITSKTLISPFCVEYICELQLLEAVGPISNIGLRATFTFSPIVADPLVGTKFLFSIANTPLAIKTDSESKTFAIQVQF